MARNRDTARRWVWFLIFTPSLLSVASRSASAAGPTAKETHFEPQQLLVRFRPGTSAALKENVHRTNGVERVLKRNRFVDGLELVKLSHPNVEAAVMALGRNPNVLYAEPDYVVEPTVVPNDPDPPPVTAGPAPLTALRVTLTDLQNPVPPNLTQYPPPDFSVFEAGITCTDPSGCVRWVGKVGTFRESQDIPNRGSYYAARLQCTPYYDDWSFEDVIHVIGAEIVPSSIYHVQRVSVACMGSEDACTAVSATTQFITNRFGDVEAPFQAPPPASLSQPDVIDISQTVAAVKHQLSLPAHPRAQLQPNLPELNTDVNVLDIVQVVDAVKRLSYSFSGPCPCPSEVTCGGSCTSCAGLCVKTCIGGDNDGEPCVNNTHCPGVCVGGPTLGAVCPSGVPGGVNCGMGGACSGVCSSVGTCRDKCGRCTP